MIKIIQIAVIGILIFLVIRLFRLIMRYYSGARENIDSRKKEREEIRKQFENIEEAKFRDITPDDEDNIKDKNNG